MAVFVRYLVPVLAEIDLAADQVTQVHVEDEAVGEAEDVLVIDEPDLSAADRERAIRVAGEQPWPAWELGGSGFEPGLLDSPLAQAGEESMRTTVDIDDEALAAAAVVLGTATKVDTVNRALAEIAARPGRVAALERLLTATDDLGDAETTSQAWL